MLKKGGSVRKYLNAVRDGEIQDLNLTNPQRETTSDLEKSIETCISFKKVTPPKEEVQAP